MSCDWAPTGREFVSGSYDRTVRLWKGGEGKARDTYHTKRMQRSVLSILSPLIWMLIHFVRHSVFSTLYTLDARFVLSGSDDSNMRIWKARAAEKLGVVDKREMARKEYRDGLRDKWGSVGDVGKLERFVFSSCSRLSSTLTLTSIVADRQRFLPKPIHNAENLRRTMLDARGKKEENRRAHAPKGVDAESLKPKSERKRAIQRVEA